MCLIPVNGTIEMRGNRMNKHETMVETYIHKQEVAYRMNEFAERIIFRGLEHDDSKLMSPEVEIFTKFTSKLKNTEYGSREYKEYLKEMGPALKHHYEHNKHHPEHFKQGIQEMTLIDLVRSEERRGGQ